MAEYHAWTVTGFVVGLEAWSEPDFGGAPDNEDDPAGSVRIASRMVERQKFFIRQRNGREIEVSLVDSGMTLRNGHVVTAIWVARRGLQHGFCILIDNLTTGAQTRLPHNIKMIRPRVGMFRTARFGLYATIPAGVALLMWLLIPGSLSSIDLNTFFMGATIALVVLFVIALIVAKLVLDYLQADDDQKIWQAAEEASTEVRSAMARGAKPPPRY